MTRTINWGELTHAYGSAEDIPGLFARLGGTEDDQVWQELWSALCHQGSVYSASWAAMPVLADIAAARAPGGPVEAVFMAGLIVTSPDEACRTRYANEIGELRGVAHSLLNGPQDSASTFVYLLQSLLAFEGVPVWSEALEGLVNEEYQIACPACSSDLFIALGEYGYFTSAGDYVGKSGGQDAAGRTDLLPAGSGELAGIAARMHQAALDTGFPDVATGVRHLFGKATCPDCATGFSVSNEVAEQWV
ncbi:hypothetical protein ACFS5L_16025 [Streptomyces phyllanthi]|uniref:Uncharacterized protein n=1 Tax=Streptomyces phyllanthi TaxID=1803180 RepID=A0A5N8W101_9ACTN|nr:hypothetical protein [Streptomyces phyllanthi]MPY39968.1 hypothetical protein [Streptomyces phyllanthi]